MEESRSAPTPATKNFAYLCYVVFTYLLATTAGSRLLWMKLRGNDTLSIREAYHVARENFSVVIRRCARRGLSNCRPRLESTVAILLVDPGVNRRGCRWFDHFGF